MLWRVHLLLFFFSFEPASSLLLKCSTRFLAARTPWLMQDSLRALVTISWRLFPVQWTEDHPCCCSSIPIAATIAIVGPTVVNDHFNFAGLQVSVSTPPSMSQCISLLQSHGGKVQSFCLPIFADESRTLCYASVAWLVDISAVSVLKDVRYVPSLSRFWIKTHLQSAWLYNFVLTSRSSV